MHDENRPKRCRNVEVTQEPPRFRYIMSYLNNRVLLIDFDQWENTKI